MEIRAVIDLKYKRDLSRDQKSEPSSVGVLYSMAGQAGLGWGHTWTSSTGGHWATFQPLFITI
jgi:hypothetical protein